MKLALFYLLLLASFVVESSFAEEQTINIQLPKRTVGEIADFYTILTGKKVTYSDGRFTPLPINIAQYPISADANGAVFSKKQAIRFLESALYLKGIEVMPKDDDTVIFTRYAEVIDQDIGEAAQKEFDKKKGKQGAAPNL